MADIYAIHSITIEDADGDRVALPIYVTFADTVGFGTLLAALASEVSSVDAITEGKIVGQSLSIQPALPGGLKTDAVALSDVELTGLITENSDAPNAKAISYAIPAFIHTAFVGDVIDETDTNVAAFIADMEATGATLRSTSDDWAYHPVSFRRGKKVTRKHS